jgi:hypothetical protein
MKSKPTPRDGTTRVSHLFEGWCGCRSVRLRLGVIKVEIRKVGFSPFEARLPVVAPKFVWCGSPRTLWDRQISHHPPKSEMNLFQNSNNKSMRIYSVGFELLVCMQIKHKTTLPNSLIIVSLHYLQKSKASFLYVPFEYDGKTSTT